MRELTPAIQEQIENIAQQVCGDVPVDVLNEYTKQLIDAWTKGEISLGLVGE